MKNKKKTIDFLLCNKNTVARRFLIEMIKCLCKNILFTENNFDLENKAIRKGS